MYLQWPFNVVIIFSSSTRPLHYALISDDKQQTFSKRIIQMKVKHERKRDMCAGGLWYEGGQQLTNKLIYIDFRVKCEHYSTRLMLCESEKRHFCLFAETIQFYDVVEFL